MRDPVKVIELKKSILEDNDADAEVLRGTLKDEKLLYINIMSSPGSGKTTLLNLLSSFIPATERIVTVEDADGASSFHFFRQKTEKVIEQPFGNGKTMESIRK